MKTAERFKLAIDESGMTVRELSEATGVSRESIYKILQGRSHNAGLPNLKVFAEALGVSIHWLG